MSINKIIILTQFDDSEYYDAAKKLGVKIEKSMQKPEVADEIYKKY